MSKKLSESNRYLRDPEMRKKMVWISVKSSSAIEGIHHPFAEGGPLMVNYFGTTGQVVEKGSKPRCRK